MFQTSLNIQEFMGNKIMFFLYDFCVWEMGVGVFKPLFAEYFLRKQKKNYIAILCHLSVLWCHW